MTEKWLPVPDFPNYLVSNLGHVKSMTRGKGSRYNRVLRGQRRYHTSSGRLMSMQVSLRKDGVTYFARVHQLVLAAFVGPCPQGMEGCHGDGDPSNNKLSNLRWDTHKNNHQDSVRHGTYSPPPFKPGEQNGFCKLTDKEVAEIRKASRKRGVLAQLSRRYSVSTTHIRRIWNGLARTARA